MKVALAGTFGHWPHVFDELHPMNGVDLIGIARVCEDEDPTGPLAHPFAGDGVEVYPSLQALIEAGKPDVVIVSCRLDRTAAVAMEAAQAGCHLMCEKPLAFDVESLVALRRTVAQAGVRMMCMLTMRTFPVFRTMRRLYREGAIGRAVLANARKSYKWGTRPGWFGDPAKYGGSIGWLAIHGLDMIQAVTGEEFISAQAMRGNFAHPERPGCEDHGVTLMGLGGGGLATVSFDYLRPAAAPTHGDDWLRVMGTGGTLEGNASREWCRLIDAEGEREIELDPQYPIYQRFIEEIQGGLEPDPMMALEDPFMLTWACIHAQQASVSGARERILPWRLDFERV